MDFDNRKVYGDTSITDGLVLDNCCLFVQKKFNQIQIFGNYCPPSFDKKLKRNVTFKVKTEFLRMKKNDGLDRLGTRIVRELLSSFDQPLKIAHDQMVGKDHLLCAYNRAGDS